MTERTVTRITITPDEITLLFMDALERDDLERADVWAGLLLRQNDPDEPINQDPS